MRGRIPRKRAFYDFETYGWRAGEAVIPVAVGVAHGPPGHRRTWAFIDKASGHSVVEAAFTHFTRLALREGIFAFVAHNGGRFDVLFLIQYARQRGWEFDMVPVGSTVLVFEVHVPGLARPLTFYDSFRIVPASLKRAAEDFQLGTQKLLGDDDYAVPANTWSETRLREGVIADCVVGLELMERVEGLFEGEGGELRATFSSSALSVVRAKVQVPDMRRCVALNMRAQPAYTGGRTEIFRHLPAGPLELYDINSAYPWAMAQQLPWGHLQAPPNASQALRKGAAGVFEATVVVPECEFPLLPYRDKAGGLYFPTGRMRSWWTAAELMQAESWGTRIEKVHDGVVSAEYTHPFAEFVEAFYAKKVGASGAAIKNFMKLVLNGAYGKFGESPQKKKVRFYSTLADALDALFDGDAFQDGVGVLSRESDLRCLVHTTESWPKQTNYVLASYITALPRIRITSMLRNAAGAAYCDTDSIHCTNYTSTPGLEIDSKKLGALKHEASGVTAVYYTPKMYSLCVEGDSATKAKGFAGDKITSKVSTLIKKGLQGPKAAALVSGKKLAQTRTELALTLMRATTHAPVRRIGQDKRWRGLSKKRRVLPHPEGLTVPWTVEQLEAGMHLKQVSPTRAPDFDEGLT